MKRSAGHYLARSAAVAAIALVLFPYYAAIAQIIVPSAPINKLVGNDKKALLGGSQSFICQLFNFLFGLLIIVSILFAIWAGYQYLMSQGDMEKLRNARNTLIYAAISVVVALLVKGLPAIVFSFFGSGQVPFQVSC